MLLRNYWYEPDKVFITHLSGIITSSDLEEIADLWHPIINAYEGQIIHNLTDVSQVESLDISLMDLQRVFKRLGKSRLAGWVIITGEVSSPWRLMVSFISQLMGFKFRLIDHFEEGLTFLNEQDDSLPPLLPFRENAMTD